MVELTNTEQTIMKCIWDHKGDISVAELLVSLKEKYQKVYARTTISVFMSYLRDKGYVTYEKKSHAFLYKPLIEEKDYQKEMMEQCLNQIFNGSVVEFMKCVLENHAADKNELEEIRNLVKQY